MVIMLLAVVVFVVAYILIISEKFPPSVIAILGGVIMIVFPIMTQENAIRYIDFNTIGLLCGMMIIVAVMRRTGVFEYLAIRTIKAVGAIPWRILVALSILTAGMSAMLDNVTTVLIIVPVTFAITDALRLRPTPFLIAEILFANIGGTATLIGDPPNILIGNSAQIGFLDFIFHNTPVVAACGLFVLLVLRLLYGRELGQRRDAEDILAGFDETKVLGDRRFLSKSLGVFVLVLVGFATHEITHVGLATISLGGGFVLLLITGVRIEDILKEVEWATLFFFIGLFILVGGLEVTGVISLLSRQLLEVVEGEAAMTMAVLWISAIASPIVDNVPFTASMIPIVKTVGEISGIALEPLWWALSLGACLGGNGTIVGASANIVVASYARRNDCPLGFVAFLKVGLPIMLGTVVIAAFYLYLVHLVSW
ncbi:MAG: ArsB/NhaD family transporter [Thermodesulfobacteriota bacterium]|jgi:Na+/H+ antiporter NhaD/arsenite permease-like protein|nr:ArsB/NhaD family transporter [Thermodesulfobacteriota bacterium]